ncbi:MAG: YncE family protein [Verrucomicrobia bacterium]|nr:YncE family protein [Verrucomicrobiota bacterium]
MKKSLWAISLLVLASVARADEYQFIKQIPVGGEGGWDYLAIDGQAQRLYVSHASKIIVVDLNNGSVAGAIADTPGVHGFAIAPELGRGFSSNGRENKVSVVDLKTLKTISKIETGENPDAIVYDSGRHEVYAFNGRSGSASVIDAKSAKVVATIPLDGKPEFAAADPESGRVFCNIEDKNEIAAIDTKSHSVVARWPLAPGEEPSGLAFDAAHHRLFAGCENKLLVMMDSTNGKVLATAPIGAGVDACAFDAEKQLAFASCGDGTLTIARPNGDKLDVAQTVQTERGARTMALDPVTHRVYLATAKFDPTQKDERGRPKMIDGTFHLLEYGSK